MSPRALGWSLIEMLMVLVIMGVLAALVGPVLLGAVTAYGVTESNVAAYGKMRYALERMAREVRQVRRSTADTASFDITAMTATNLDFVKNDGQRVIIAFTGPSVTMTYSAVGNGVLTDWVNAAPVAPCVTGFRYLQLDGTTSTASAGAVQFVEIGLTLQSGANNYCNRVRVDLRGPQ